MDYSSVWWQFLFDNNIRWNFEQLVKTLDLLRLLPKMYEYICKQVKGIIFSLFDEFTTHVITTKFQIIYQIWKIYKNYMYNKIKLAGQKSKRMKEWVNDLRWLFGIMSLVILHKYLFVSLDKVDFVFFPYIY